MLIFTHIIVSVQLLLVVLEFLRVLRVPRVLRTMSFLIVLEFLGLLGVLAVLRTLGFLEVLSVPRPLRGRFLLGLWFLRFLGVLRVPWRLWFLRVQIFLRVQRVPWFCYFLENLGAPAKGCVPHPSFGPPRTQPQRHAPPQGILFRIYFKKRGKLGKKAFWKLYTFKKAVKIKNKCYFFRYLSCFRTE